MAYIDFKNGGDFGADGPQDVIGYRADASKAPRSAINSPNLVSQDRPRRLKATRQQDLRGPGRYVARDWADYRRLIPPVVLTIRQNDRWPDAALLSSSCRS